MSLQKTRYLATMHAFPCPMLAN